MLVMLEKGDYVLNIKRTIPCVVYLRLDSVDHHAQTEVFSQNGIDFCISELGHFDIKHLKFLLLRSLLTK